jgi:hypothetical protein
MSHNNSCISTRYQAESKRGDRKIYSSSCCALAGFLRKILSPLASKSESFVKNSSHFVQLLKSFNLQSLDTLVGFGSVNLFTTVAVDEAPQVVTNKLHNDDTDVTVCLADRSHYGTAGGLSENHILMINSSKRRIQWLWAALYQQHLHGAF